jgi:branched-subunit amino acid transport protein AzlD
METHPDNPTSFDKMMKRIKTWFSRRAERGLEELKTIQLPYRILGILIVVGFSLIISYLAAHQIQSTGFFTESFGALEMIFLYGSLLEWIVVAGLESIKRRNLSRDIDAFGGIIFVTIGLMWLLVVFPFEFSHFADVSPDFLQFLVQWISNDVARVLIVLGFVVHLVSAVYYGILRVLVRKALAREDGELEDSN